MYLEKVKLFNLKAFFKYKPKDKSLTREFSSTLLRDWGKVFALFRINFI
jgi:hypothetical protein